MHVFIDAHRCPQCSADADMKDDRTGTEPRSTRFVGSRAHRRCHDCGFNWIDKAGLNVSL